MGSLLIVVLSFLASGGQVVPGGSARPNALLKLEAQRARIRTAVIEWSETDYGRDGRMLYYTSRLGLRERISHVRGDENGVMLRLPSGEPSPLTAPGQYMAGHQVILETEDAIWDRFDETTRAEFKAKAPGLAVVGAPDLRSLGVTSVFTYDDVHDALWKDPGTLPRARAYEESREGDFEVVSAKTDFGVIKWWIDPQRGWQAARVALLRDGAIQTEARITLAQFEGVWYPEAVMYFRSSFKGGTEPARTLRVHRASFNGPDQPETLGPADIGIEVGMYVEQQDPLTSRPIAQGFFDGQKMASFAEYAKRKQAGELREGPAVQRSRAEEGALERVTARFQDELAKIRARRVTLPAAERLLSAWEKYTLEFIIKYRLDDSQTQSALKILHDCQEQGLTYLSKRAERIDDLEKRLDPKSEAKLTQAQRDESRTELKRLVEPVNKIFENQLKPRLDRLPTRAQRAAVDAPPASRPTR